jgi:hypothetical protein
MDFVPFHVMNTFCVDLPCFWHTVLRPLRNYLSGVKTWSILLDADVSAFVSTSLRMTLSGITKLSSHIPRGRLPLEPHHLEHMCSYLDLTSPLDVCVRVVLTFGFWGMLRASNLIIRGPASSKQSDCLTRRQVFFTHKGVELSITWSKTRQTHDFVHKLPLSRLPHAVLCPVAAYMRLLQICPGVASDLVIAMPCHRSKSLVPVSRSVVLARFNQLLTLCDLSPRLYSLHSLRSGGASLAAKAGISDLAIKKHGDWRSEAFQQYISFAVDQRYDVTYTMASYID